MTDTIVMALLLVAAILAVNGFFMHKTLFMIHKTLEEFLRQHKGRT